MATGILNCFTASRVSGPSCTRSIPVCSRSNWSTSSHMQARGCCSSILPSSRSPASWSRACRRWSALWSSQITTQTIGSRMRVSSGRAMRFTVGPSSTNGPPRRFALPTVFTMLFEYLDSSGSRIESLKRAVIGGSAVPPSMIERLASLYGCTVLQVWGMTETSPLGTMCTPTPALATLSPEDQRKKLQTAGRVQYGMELKIVDPNGERLSHDGKNPGDLWVRSGWAAKGYFRDESSRLDADGWFPTGDVATIDDLGYMRITDRTKDVIKSGGEWISSVDVESIAYAHPAVKMAAVVGAAHPKWEERLVLIVALKESARVSEKELMDFLRPRMAALVAARSCVLRARDADDGHGQDSHDGAPGGVSRDPAFSSRRVAGVT